MGILREGLIEFPQEERLLIKLADTLSEAGWRRHQEWTYYDEEGYIRHDYTCFAPSVSTVEKPIEAMRVAMSSS